MARLPDGVFRLSGRIIFVEVEFSQKSNVRYMEIFRIYSRQGGPGRVVYFYRKRSDLDFLIALTKANPRFGFFPYSKSLPPPEDLMGESQLKVMSLAQFLKT